jgi:hypothetical protein
LKELTDGAEVLNKYGARNMTPSPPKYVLLMKVSAFWQKVKLVYSIE